MLPQSAAVAFVLAEVAVNGAVMERDLVVRCLVSRLCRCAFSALYCCPWVQCRLISRLMVLLWRLSCLAISATVQWRDRYWIWYRSSWVSCVAHGNLSCRKGRMLPHTGLFLLWKVALQMRICRRLKIQILVFRRPFCRGYSSIQKQPYDKFVLREG